MTTTVIPLSKGQYLSQIEPFKSSGIPNGCILYKEITGCGATESEIYAKRNSIIVVPHQPVIKSKVKNHNEKNSASFQLLGVHKTVTESHIETYISSKATYKKILTTPEGLAKILRVFENDLPMLYSDFFLLLDECERIITDVSYRGKITAPIDELLKFERKALVSATPIEFSHPILSQLDRIVIQPDFDYRKPIDVIATNSVPDTLKKCLTRMKSEQPVFLFINSTNCIVDILDILDLRSQSFVYCGEKSVAKLLVNQIKRASSELDLKRLDNHIFLTSRYFSALDIKLEYKPNVIMVTDVYTADHSILDPATEIIQIAGRFRNGFNRLTHIANFNPELPSKTPDEAKSYLNGVFDTHTQVVDLLKRLDTESSSNVLKFYSEESPTSNYYTESGHINDFMVDNFLYEQRVKGYYQQFDNLRAAYGTKALHFEPQYFEEQYWLSDKDRIYRKSRLSIKAQQKETFRQLDSFESNKPGKFVLHNSHDLIRNLRALFPALTPIYDLIGYQGMLKANFKTDLMMKYKNSAQKVKNIERLAPFIYSEFVSNSERFDSEISSILPDIYYNAGVKVKSLSSILNEFFYIKRSTRSGQHVTIFGEKRDLSNLSPFD